MTSPTTVSANRRTAPYPFNRRAADLVLQTSDLVDFRVRRTILAEASPAFEDMFSVPLSPIGSTSGGSVDGFDEEVHEVSVAEPSQILDQLLRLCYPVADPVFTCTEDVRAVLEAAMKYRMNDVVVIMRKHLIDFTLLHANPLRVFAIACRHRFAVEAKAAADYALGKPLRDWFVPELEEISAGAYFRLLRYHKTGLREDSPNFLEPPIPLPTSRSEHVSRTADSDAFNMPDADVVLRTSDGVDLGVHQLILCIASYVFQTMLTNPGAFISKSRHMVPLIFVDEDSHTLTNLLRFCYPINVDDICLDDTAMISKLLTAAMKYRIVGAVKFCIKFADLAPLRVYAIACMYSRREGQSRSQWDKIAKDAARQTLRRGIDGYVEELEDITGVDFHRLLRYREACSVKASEVALKYLSKPELIVTQQREEWVWYLCLSWSKCPGDVHTPQAVGPRPWPKPRAWWCKYVRGVAATLVGTPYGDVAHDPKLFQTALVEGTKCFMCKSRALSDLQEFSVILATAVDSELSSVTIDFP